MQTNTEYNTAMAQPRPRYPHIVWTEPRAVQQFRPQGEDGLSREELRRIVIDLIG